MVEPPQGALPVSEVGGCQLVQDFQGDHRAVAIPLGFSAELLLIQENCERFLPFEKRQDATWLCQASLT